MRKNEEKNKGSIIMPKKPVKTPINELPPGEYNMILRHKLIITPDKKFLQMTYSPVSNKIQGDLKQMVMIGNKLKKSEEES